MFRFFLKDFLRYKKYQYKNLIKHHKFYIKNFNNLELVREIKSKGYFVIKNFIDEADCSILRNEIKKFIEFNSDLIWQDSIQSDQRIYGFENLSYLVNLKLKKFNDFSKSVALEYLKQDVDLYMTMANKTSYKFENLGSGGGWHKDSYSKQFKSILYLVDVDTKRGPFQIIKKSNSNLFMLKLFYRLKKKFPSTRFTNEEIKSLVKSSDIVELTGKAGTLLLVDTSYLHRGKPIEIESRYALTDYFFPKIDFVKHFDHFTPLIKKKN